MDLIQLCQKVRHASLRQKNFLLLIDIVVWVKAVNCVSGYMLFDPLKHYIRFACFTFIDRSSITHQWLVYDGKDYWPQDELGVFSLSICGIYESLWHNCKYTYNVACNFATIHTVHINPSKISIVRSALCTANNSTFFKRFNRQMQRCRIERDATDNTACDYRFIHPCPWYKNLGKRFDFQGFQFKRSLDKQRIK